MATEIERKYRVRGNGWRPASTGHTHIRQGYLAENEQVEVRVRIRDDRTASLTIKASGGGLERAEFEFEANLGEADALLQHCRGRLIDKLRHTIPANGRTWLVDEYRGALAGLTVAEVELAAGDPGPVRAEWPDWIAAEVTGDAAYSNARLAADGLPPSEKAP